MKNSEDKYIDNDGVSWHDYKEYVFIGLLGFCDCRDDKLYHDIFTVLEAYGKAAKEGELLYYDKLLAGNPAKYVELILHCLTRAELLEHGSSLRGSWLTQKGQEVVEKLQAEKQTTHR
jgi:hypothetical protein